MLTPQELAERQFGLGGSDVGTALGLGRFKGPLQLYLEKRGEVPISQEESDAMYWGNHLEDKIAEWYAAKTERKVRRLAKRVDKARPWLFVHIDRQIVNDPRGPGSLSVKNLNAFCRIDSYDDLPEDYILQHQIELHVCEMAWGAFAILIGGQKPVHFEAERDQALIDAALPVLDDFWHEHVMKGIPPPPDGTRACRALLKKLYPKSTGLIKTLTTQDVYDTAVHVYDLKTKIATMKKAEFTMQNWLMWRMADAELALIPGWGKIAWKSTKDRTVWETDLVRLKQEFPDAYKAVTTKNIISGHRNFKLKPDKPDLGVEEEETAPEKDGE